MSLFGSPDIAKLHAKNNIEGLIKALNYTKDPSIIPKAIFALGATKNPKAVDALIGLLSNDDSDLRAIAIEALGGMGDQRVLQPLLRAINDTNLYVRSRAANALGDLGNQEAIQPLASVLDDIPRKVRACKSITDSNVASQRLTAIRQLSMSVAGSLKKLGWIPDKTCAGAVYCIEFGIWDQLVEIGEPAVEALRMFFHIDISGYAYPNRGSELKEAVKVLGRIGSEQSILLLLEIQKVRDSKDYKLHPLSSKIQSEIDSLSTPVHAALYDAACRTAVPFKSSLTDLQSSGFYLFNAILETIRGLQQNGSGDAKDMLAYLLNHTSSEIKIAAACALAQLGDRRAESILVDYLKESNGGISRERERVIASLGSLGSSQTIPVLVELIAKDLHDSTGKREQQNAARELQRINWMPDTDSIEFNIKYYLLSDQFDQCVAVGRPAIEPLIALLKTLLRNDAASVLEKIGVDAVEPLCLAIKKNSQAVSGFVPAKLPPGASIASEKGYWEETRARLAMTQLLGKIGDSSAVETLNWVARHDCYVVDRLENEDIPAKDLYWPIRESAEEALRLIASRS